MRLRQCGAVKLQWNPPKFRRPCPPPSATLQTQLVPMRKGCRQTHLRISNAVWAEPCSMKAFLHSSTQDGICRQWNWFCWSPDRSVQWKLSQVESEEGSHTYLKNMCTYNIRRDEKFILGLHTKMKTPQVNNSFSEGGATAFSGFSISIGHKPWLLIQQLGKYAHILVCILHLTVWLHRQTQKRLTNKTETSRRRANRLRSWSHVPRFTASVAADVLRYDDMTFCVV